MSRNRKLIRPLKDLQLLKGRSMETMEMFDGSITALHEAKLLARDDQKTSPWAMYIIYKCSEGRIVWTLPAPDAIYLGIAA